MIPIMNAGSVGKYGIRFLKPCLPKENARGWWVGYEIELEKSLHYLDDFRQRIGVRKVYLNMY